MGYLGVDFGLPLGQDAASMPPPTRARNDPAQAMKMAEPNSYLHREKLGGKSKRGEMTSAERRLEVKNIANTITSMRIERAGA